jgi:hypothetical protein
MPFINSDLYLTSGTTKLINSWVDPVYKFDSSSFYNWEQDNLPIYDLEDRDDFLWEQHGYPTSSVVGMTLTVSDCNIDNKRVFATVQNAVDALPATIRFPVIIDVAASADLGSLYIEDKTFEGAAAGLEIRNIGFGKILCGSSVSPSSTIQAVTGSGVSTFASTDLSNAITDAATASGVSLYATDAYTDWWNQAKRVFALNPEWTEADSAGTEQTVEVSVKFEDSANTFFDSTANQFIVSRDFSSNDNSTGDDIAPDSAKDQSFRSAPTAASDARVVGMVYGNYLKDVHITNCSGRVYLRNFCVDGGSQAVLTTTGSQDVEVGIHIKNSDVVIENCSTTRCKKAGIKIENSNVVLNRGFISYRNYELVNEVGYLDGRTSKESYGLLAVNSDVTVSASTEDNKGLPIDSPFCFTRNKVGIKLINSNLKTPENVKYRTNMDGDSVVTTTGQHNLVIQSFLNTEAGVVADRSLIECAHRLAVFQNEVGIDFVDSTLKCLNLCVEHNLGIGMSLKGSTVLYNYNYDSGSAFTTGPCSPCNKFAHNKQHIVMRNSTYLPKYGVDMPTYYSTFSLVNSHGYSAKETQGRVTLPMVEVAGGSRFDLVSGRLLNKGYNNNAATSDFYTGGQDPNGVGQCPVFGAAALVDGGSTLKLMGHGGYQTLAGGPSNPDKQQFAFGFVARNGSHIEVNGPTTVVQYGIDFLAEDHSTVDIGPHREESGDIAVSSFSLDDTTNHTMVQLHSSRACLVANRNSSIKMKDLGDYHGKWANKYILDGGADILDYMTGTDGLDTSAYHSAGYLQFYPNPFHAVGTGADEINIGSKLDIETLKPAVFNAGSLTQITNFDNTVSAASHGGMCVRALGNSEVYAKNIHFPCGWVNTSEAYYDASASECAHLRIWNIADNSKLEASYMIVDDLHPIEASGSYHGPFATYTSGAAVHLSGAPYTTPNTGPLSVLDAFGKMQTLIGGKPIPDANWDNLQVGKVTAENVGPFRIYVSTDPKAKYLGYVSGTEGFFNAYNGSDTPYSLAYHTLTNAGLVQGPPAQLFAQGYNPSGDCSGPHEFSSVFGEFGGSAWIANSFITTPPANDMWTDDTNGYFDFGAEASATLEASSFYYAKDMLDKYRPSVWLDESGMNTFANAKNATVGLSNRGKFVNYFQSRRLSSGESYSDFASGYGLGFKSSNLFDPDRYL